MGGILINIVVLVNIIVLLIVAVLICFAVRLLWPGGGWLAAILITVGVVGISLLFIGSC